MHAWLGERIDLDRVIVDHVRSSGTSRDVAHRLGDYFAAIQLLPGLPNGPSLRLVFHRRPDAGRFWKDVMVNLLDEVAKASQEVFIELDSKSEEKPVATN